jgi:hypothetical protein
MKWLSRLKKSSTHPEMDATKATETLFVVSVAPILAPIQKFEGISAPANDPAPTPAASAEIQDTQPTPTTAQAVFSESRNNLSKPEIGTFRPPGLSAKLFAASLALDTQIHATGQFDSSDENPDRWCYPESTAMTSSETDLFTARLARFTDKGVSHGDAERLADGLVNRDRDSDDRWLCLECTHLGGYGRTDWRCGNWQRAGVARQARDAQLPADLVFQLQRCAGLTHAFNPTPVTQ